MTADQEREMHDIAERLEALTRGTGWEMVRYIAVGKVMKQQAEYCAVAPAPTPAFAHRGELVAFVKEIRRHATLEAAIEQMRRFLRLEM